MLGSSGLSVSVVGTGTSRTFDVRSAREEALRVDLVSEALAAGSTLFDSSPMYGEAERVLGAALAERREAAFVATKVWTRSAREGGDQIQRSLDYFGGRVELYQLHNLVAWREHLPRLEALKADGRVRAIGATHYSHGALPELVTVMETGRLDAIQIPYNALDRVVEAEVLPLAAALGLGVLVMLPLGGGGLARRAPPAGALAPFASYGVSTWPQILLKWLLSNPDVTCVIPATSRPGRPTENAAAGQPPWFGPAERERISALARDPGA
jgi:aryl-alcohol dehydrogenase-like predicted oxidoreductase